MRVDLGKSSWPIGDLAEGVEVLLRRAGLVTHTAVATATPLGQSSVDPDALGLRIEGLARQLGAEAEPVQVVYPELPRMLEALGPGIALIRCGEEQRLALLVSGRGRAVHLLAPDLRIRTVPAEVVCRAMARDLETKLEPEIDRILERAMVPRRRRPLARRVIMRERLGAAQVGGCWVMRLPPGVGFVRQVRQARLTRPLGVLLTSHFIQFLLYLGSWWLIGKAALQGRFEWGWLIAWFLLLATMVPFKALSVWSQGKFSIGVGGLLKRRLLFGALNLHPDVTRHQGSGQLLGRVIESEAVESLALSGGFIAVMAVIQIVMSTLVLKAGAGGWLHVVLLWVFIGIVALLAWYMYRRQDAWTGHRMELTNDLVERMVGHRTRLAQEPPERWHDCEDQAVERYLGLSAAMDRSVLRLVGLVPRGWMIAGVAALGPAFVSGGAGIGALAVALGGLILANQALGQLCGGLTYLSSAALAWKQVAPLFEAAASAQDSVVPWSPERKAIEDAQGMSRTALMEADNLDFCYRLKGDPVLKGLDLHIRRGERLLLEGPSGGGKSTLVSLLVGMREPDGGLLLLDGMDRQTMGPWGWRQRVVAAPQFHENHVLTETFAFNLLMGRQWPPRPGDDEEATAICQELGLGDLLKRMPAGLLQTVGDSGWQLSHGEKSRLYIARALLQRAELIVLDESFASLDPENLRQALTCVLRRAPTLLVVAHP